MATVNLLNIFGCDFVALTYVDVVRSVRDYFEFQGYTVSTQLGPSGKSEEITATKDKDSYIIEAVGDSATAQLASDGNVVYAVGKIVKRMKEKGFWIHYGIAMPKSDYKLLRDFEIEGFETLGLHLFLVENLFSLLHLHPQEAVQLLEQLKDIGIVNFNAWKL
ncbi:MAG: hypothetical protein NWE92_08220 [Candidatus Bathyarchaeota archaeon]|nr:hypothetical protein [Candidatus Bathyarchaeota archaeon]